MTRSNFRMDSQDLRLSIEYVGSSGIILSAEQKAALETSLTILKSNHKFEKVYFWGKILGVKDDYFVAQGVGKNDFEDRKNLYRYLCCQSWSGNAVYSCCGYPL